MKTLLPLLADPEKVTKEDLKNFLSKSEMKKIIFDKVSTVLPKAAKVEDFKKFMGSKAGKKLIHFVQGDVKDLDGKDVMDLFSYQFKYCKTEDDCEPFSIKASSSSLKIACQRAWIPKGSGDFPGHRCSFLHS